MARSDTLISKILATDNEVISLVAQQTIEDVMRALKVSGLVVFDEASRQYCVGQSCSEETFRRNLMRELGRSH